MVLRPPRPLKQSSPRTQKTLAEVKREHPPQPILHLTSSFLCSIASHHYSTSAQMSLLFTLREHPNNNKQRKREVEGRGGKRGRASTHKWIICGPIRESCISTPDSDSDSTLGHPYLALPHHRPLQIALFVKHTEPPSALPRGQSAADRCNAVRMPALRQPQQQRRGTRRSASLAPSRDTRTATAG